MRVFFVVLDSVGIGEARDAADFGDSGCDTLGHIADQVEKFNLPGLESLGLGVIKSHPKLAKTPTLNSRVAVLEEISRSKDTTAGHWEMMNVPVLEPFPKYPDGFPAEIMDQFVAETGFGYIGNIVASGTQILEDMGEEHLRTGKLIVYTSADSVFQIAAHADVVSPEKLYEVCKKTREILDPYHVGRVIARPFSGTPGNFIRLNNKRHDYSIEPIDETFLQKLQSEGVRTVSVGKINDIFATVGIDEAHHTDDNRDVMKTLIKMRDTADEGTFVFANLVDFDSVYGHRRNVQGYYEALKEFDDFIPEFIDGMKDTDLFVITADHGCDPAFEGTDHTRENVPFIAYSPSYDKFENLGTKRGFMFGGVEALKHLGVESGVGSE